LGLGRARRHRFGYTQYEPSFKRTHQFAIPALVNAVINDNKNRRNPSFKRTYKNDILN